MNTLARSGLVCLAVWVAAAGAAEPAVYTVDAAASDIHWRVYKAGSFSRFGHNHVISVGELTGTVTRDAESGAATFELTIPVAGLVVDDPVLRTFYGEEFSSVPSEKDIAGTRDNMLGEKVLDAEHHATLMIRGRLEGSALEAATLTVAIELLGRSIPVSVPSKIIVADDVITASGAFRLTHEQLGMEPFSIMLGALAVAPELDFSFDVRATRVP